MYQRKQQVKETIHFVNQKAAEAKHSAISGSINQKGRIDKHGLKKLTAQSEEADNEEWVVFGESDDLRTIWNGKVDSSSVLSTRLSVYHSVTHDILSSDVEDYNDADLDNDDDDDDDSFIGDIRESYNSISRLRVKELETEMQNELVSKVNAWRNNMRSISLSKSSMNIIKSSKPKPKANVTTYFPKQTDRKQLNKAVNRLFDALQRDNAISNVEHEGVFMNNPDLESSIPGYWKRIMLDNLLFSNNDQNCMLNMSVSRDDILKNGKHFWELDESASISTGWDSGNNILGY